MATTISCDKCGAPVKHGFKITVIGVNAPDYVDLRVSGEYCSVKCIELRTAEFHRRPDFAGTRAMLDDVNDLEERALRGEYDDVGPPVDDSGVPFDLGGLLARKKAQGPAARSHASRAAEATAKITASRVAH